jgi:hypothetical protein
MRSLKDNQALTPVQVDGNFPFGAIIDETGSALGTAVVREIYNDVLVNLYKLLSITGNPTNGIEDSEGTSYQLLGALQQLYNLLTDVERVLTLASGIFTIDLDITLSPNKCIFFAKVVGGYTAGNAYTFMGSKSSPVYGFTSPTGFNSGDNLLLILDQSGVRAYSFGGGIPSSGYATFTASAIVGADPFYYLPLSGSAVPQYPKYLTMYIQNGDGDNQNKMITPAYVADTRIIFGMPSPTDWPSQVIKLYYA